MKKDEELIKKVCDIFGVSYEEITGRRRTAKIVRARQSAMYFLWQTQNLSLSEIGQLLGGRTPSTISYGYQKTANSITGKNNLSLELIKSVYTFSQNKQREALSPFKYLGIGFDIRWLEKAINRRS